MRLESTLRPRHSRFFATLTALAACLVTPCASATDGVLEIHQTCVATGCFPGDSPGFPVEIGASGSYVLTSNLQVPDENTTAIEIEIRYVTIDLNGFAIAGVTVCSGTPATCSPTGNGAGISGNPGRVRVLGGFIRGMGGVGVSLGSYSSVERVLAESNGGAGIGLAFGGTVRDSQAVSNGRAGISAGGAGGGVVSRSTAHANGLDGISCGTCTVTHSTASRNGGQGISIGGGGLVLGNTITDNDLAGLSVPTLSAYGHNVLLGNADGTAAAQIGGGGVPIDTNICVGVVCP